MLSILLITNLKEGLAFAAEVGYPVVLRPRFTLNGTGGVLAYNSDEMGWLLTHALDLSPVSEVLLVEVRK